MKIAIVGAGFCGVAAAYHLSRTGHQVKIFDDKGLGGGASGVATGLLHPYPGKEGRLSWMGYEAMQASRELLGVAEQALGKPVADYSGILRVTESKRFDHYPDVEKVGDNTYLIKSGITVFSNLYLEGLFKASNVELVSKKISSLQELSDFDFIVLAVGYGIREFAECAHLNLRYVKGQVLTCKHDLEKSIIENGYRAVTERPGICHVGATYERSFTNGEECKETAVNLLNPQFEVVDCKAGVRVANAAGYHPSVEKVKDNCFAITGLGSRGLLYHALIQNDLSAAILSPATFRRQ